MGASFSVRVSDGRVKDVDYRATSCATMLACCEALTELGIGLPVERAMSLTERDLRRTIRGMHPGHADRVSVALRALRGALAVTTELQESEG